MKKKILFLIVILVFLTLGLGAQEDQEQARVIVMKNPKLFKIVEPVYPEQAIKKKIEGLVILQVCADEQGRVTEARPIPNHEFHPLLLEAAIVAVKQWKYEPFLIDGQARELNFTVQINFELNGKKAGGVVGGVVGGVLFEPKKNEKEQAGPGGVTRLAVNKRPQIRKRVEPIYPEEAKQAKLQGIVIVEATTDKEGKVVDARVINEPGSRPLLEEAALAAVRQWEYDPYIKDGQALPVTFTVNVTFSLKKQDKENRP